MEEKTSIIQNSVIYFIGNVGSKALTFMLIPIYSHFLSKSQFGQYDIFLTTLSLLGPIVTLQMSESVYRWLKDAETSAYKRKEAITNSLFTVVSGQVIFLLLSVFLALFTEIKYINYFFFSLLSTGLFQYFQQITRGLRNNKLYSKSGIVNAVCQIVFNVIFLYTMNDKVTAIFLSIILSYFTSTIYIIISSDILRNIRINTISQSVILDLVSYSWPLIPNLISWWLVTFVNRYIVMIFLGIEQNGVFAIANRFPSIIVILNSIFSMALQDHVLSSDKIDIKASNILFNKFIKLQFCSVLLLIPATKLLFTYFVDLKFINSLNYLPYLYTAAAFFSIATFLEANLVKAKKTMDIFYSTFIGAVINIVITFLLIEKIDLYAPTAGTLLGFFGIWISRNYWLKSSEQIRPELLPLSLLLFCIVVFIYMDSIGSYYIEIGLLIAATLLSWIFNKELIQHLGSSFLKSVQIKLGKN